MKLRQLGIILAAALFGLSISVAVSVHFCKLCHSVGVWRRVCTPVQYSSVKQVRRSYVA